MTGSNDRARRPVTAARGARRPSGRPTAAGAAELEERILAVATRAFLAHGYAATSIETIAAGAGVAKRTLYARWRDKQALFRAVLERLMARWLAAPEPDAPEFASPAPTAPMPASPTPAAPAPAAPAPAAPAPAASAPTPSEPTPPEPIPSEPTRSEPTPSAPTLSQPTRSEPTPSERRAHEAAGLEATLLRTARRVLAVALEPDALALHRLIVAESGRFPELAEMLRHAGAADAMARIAALLAAEMAAGRLAPHDPAFAAEQFLYLVLTGPQRRALGFAPALDTAGLEAWARAAVALFLNGCRRLS